MRMIRFHTGLTLRIIWLPCVRLDYPYFPALSAFSLVKAPRIIRSKHKLDRGHSVSRSCVPFRAPLNKWVIRALCK